MVYPIRFPGLWNVRDFVPRRLLAFLGVLIIICSLFVCLEFIPQPATSSLDKYFSKQIMILQVNLRVTQPNYIEALKLKKTVWNIQQVFQSYGPHSESSPEALNHFNSLLSSIFQDNYRQAILLLDTPLPSGLL